MHNDPLEPRIGWFKMRWAVYIQLVLVVLLAVLYLYKIFGWSG